MKGLIDEQISKSTDADDPKDFDHHDRRLNGADGQLDGLVD
jgi:hypothetical protein